MRGFFVLLLTGVAALPLPAAPLQAGPSGLQGYWPLDSLAGGSSADLSGNGHTLTVSGAAALVPGTFGNAATFDNSDDQMTAADAASLNVGSSGFTVSAFVRPSATLQDRVVNKWNGTMGWILDINETTGGAVMAGHLRMRFGDGTTNVDTSFNGSLGTNVWHHVTGVVDRSGAQLRLYVDGTQIGTSQAIPGALGSLSNTALLGVGGIPSNPGNPFGGGIDEIRFYTRALTPAEVAVVAAGVPGPVLVSATPGQESVALVWTAPAGGATSYTLQRSNSSGSGYATVASGLTGTAYTDLNVPSTGPVYYILVAETSVGASRPSNELSTTSLPVPQVPRYNDHEEGTQDGNCACGAAGFGGGPAALLLLALLLPVLRRRP